MVTKHVSIVIFGILLSKYRFSAKKGRFGIELVHGDDVNLSGENNIFRVNDKRDVHLENRGIEWSHSVCNNSVSTDSALVMIVALSQTYN